MNKQNENNLTIIIPNRYGKYIDLIIENYKSLYSEYFDKVKFIVVNQCDNLPFKRGQLINIGYIYSNSPWIMIVDNDVIPTLKENPIEKYNKLGAFVDYRKIKDITIEGDTYYLNYEYDTIGFGGVNFLSSMDFESVNGFSNLCEGWGAEDNIFALKLNMVRYNNTIYHIHHDKRIEEDYLKHNQEVLKAYQYNRINKDEDGYKQTKYNLLSMDEDNDVLTLNVNNITVDNNFKYNYYLLKH